MDKAVYIERIKTIYGCFYAAKGDMITDQLKLYSAHTRNELAMLGSLIKDGDNIIDIGAHIGTFSIPFATFNKRKGKVFSFEAETDNFDLFVKNIAENNLTDVIIPMHAIVADTKQRYSKLQTRQDNSATYYFLPDTNSPNVNISEVINIDEWYSTLSCRPKIDLIKIDVEGSELSVLRSCRQLVQKFKPILYIEINIMALHRFKVTSDEIDCSLRALGYHFFRNIGPRNSNNDDFEIARLEKVEDGGEFFDLLAIHPFAPRYPKTTT